MSKWKPPLGLLMLTSGLAIPTIAFPPAYAACALVGDRYRYGLLIIAIPPIAPAAGAAAAP